MIQSPRFLEIVYKNAQGITHKATKTGEKVKILNKETGEERVMDAIQFVRSELPEGLQRQLLERTPITDRLITQREAQAANKQIKAKYGPDVFERQLDPHPDVKYTGK